MPMLMKLIIVLVLIQVVMGSRREGHQNRMSNPTRDEFRRVGQTMGRHNEEIKYIKNRMEGLRSLGVK
jgi:hypothetical protein